MYLTSSDVIFKLLAFTFAMIVVPIGGYFVTVNTVFKGTIYFITSFLCIPGCLLGCDRGHWYKENTLTRTQVMLLLPGGLLLCWPMSSWWVILSSL